MRIVSFIVPFIISIAVFTSKGQCDDTFDTLHLRPEIREIVECIDSQSQTEVQKIIQVIQGFKSPRFQLEDQYVGEGSHLSRQYQHFLALVEKASKRELFLLTSHPNGAVRCYSAWALVMDSTTDLLKLAVSHIQDTERVSYFSGCIGNEKLVGDLIIDRVSPFLGPWSGRKLNAWELATLDSLLICTPNSLASRTVALERTAPLEYLYDYIRELAISTKNSSARRALERFQKPEDSNLMLDK